MSRKLSLLPVLFAASAIAQEDPRPLETRWQVDYSGSAEIGVEYPSDDNFMFGRYNANESEGAAVFGNLDWLADTGAAVWDLQGQDIGTDVPYSRIEWDRGDLSVYFELESSYQVSNDSGRSPFRGSDLRLPEDWVASNVTSGFTALEDNSRSIEQLLERDRYTIGMSRQFSAAWRFETNLAYEEKEGTRDIGAAIFQDASAGHAAILPADVDEESIDFDVALSFTSDSLLLNGSLFYNDYDNNNDALLWQNPYSVFGGSTRYPEGIGGLALAPDNEYQGGRLMGTWFIMPGLRFQVDGSYAETEQDQNFLPYTVNPNLSVTEPLPRRNLDGETETSTMDTRLFYRPGKLPRLNLEMWWHGEQRDHTSNRAGYQYVLGDGGSQVSPDYTVYNTGHDYDINRTGIEGSYPMPLKSKLWLKYEYEKVERENAAVDETKEDKYQLRYRIPLFDTHSSRLELNYADRRASVRNWDQSYYALLDTGLINRTPDNQRYITHPLLAQYHMANRERSEAKLDLDWQPSMNWNLSANLLWRDDDYDKTELGLEEEQVYRASMTASWVPNDSVSASLYSSYDNYDRDQSNRSFRGGQEKNAFAVTPPLPQASDPARNWALGNEDEVITVGFNLEWQLRDDIELMADYSYVSTDSDYDFSDGGGTGLVLQDLPANDESDQHHLIVEGAYHLRENLSITVNYQYWNYDSEDWAINNLGMTSIDKVLTLGEQEADEDLHYISTSITYRWK